VLSLLMRSGRPSVVLFVCALVAVSNLAAPGQELPTYPVHGVVLNSLTHEPIARALVQAPDDSVLTDNEGHFELNLPAGVVGINIRRPGYDTRGPSTNHTVRVAPNMPSLDFYLIPEAVITGHITLANGDEADGIRIAAYRKRNVNGSARWFLQGVATSNSEGVFRLANLEAPGSYLLYSMPSHDRVGPLTPGAASYGYPSLYYPGVADLSAAGLITLSPGQQAEADFILARQSFYPVTIAVANSQEGRGAHVQSHDSSGRVMDVSTRWNPQQRVAQVDLPNGHYYAEARSRTTSSEYGRVDFSVAGAPLQGLRIKLLPLQPVQVEVHKEFTATSNSGSQIVRYPDPAINSNPGLNVTFSSTEPFNRNVAGSGLRRPEGSSDNSLFQIDNLTPGSYWVHTNAFEGYVSSITCGGVDLARDPLVVGPGNTTAPIVITLRNDAGGISGKIDPSSSASGDSVNGVGEVTSAFVFAVPLFPTTSQMSRTTALASSQFTFPNLAPGSYLLFALDEDREIDAIDPEELAPYRRSGQTVKVEAGGLVNAELEVMKTGEASAQ
jgi:hypothetical protein